MEKDYEQVNVELTPSWWKDKKCTIDAFVVIPDTEYEQEGFEDDIDYGDAEGKDVDFNTGVIVKAPIGYLKFAGHWCHYRKHGPYEFHPFRQRFSNGEKDVVESKMAKLVKVDDMVIITDKKIFNA